MITMTPVLSILSSASSSLAAGQNRRDEIVFIKGETDTPPGGFINAVQYQNGIAFVALQSIRQLGNFLKINRIATLGMKFDVLINISQMACAGILSYFATSHQFKTSRSIKVINFIHKNNGVFFYCTYVASVVAMLVLGEYLFSGISLFFILVGVLDRCGKLPIVIQKKLHALDKFAFIPFAVFAGNMVVKIIIGIEVVLLISIEIFRRFKNRNFFLSKELVDSCRPQDFKKVKQIAVTAYEDVNENYMFEERLIVPLSPSLIHDVKVSDLLTEFDAMNFGDKVFSNTVENVRNGLVKLVDQVTNNADVVSAQPELKMIIKGIKTLRERAETGSRELSKRDSDTIITIFDNLYRNAGLCPAAIKSAIKEESLNFYELKDFTIERTRLFALTESFRRAFFTEVFSLLIGNIQRNSQNVNMMKKAFSRIITQEMGDQHFFTIMKWLVGKQFGLSITELEEDPTIQEIKKDPYMMMLSGYYASKIISTNSIATMLNVNALIESIYMQIGDTINPHGNSIAWWAQYIGNHLSIAQEQKDKLIEEMQTTQTFYGVPMTERVGTEVEPEIKIKKEFILAMLYAEGIIKGRPRT